MQTILIATKTTDAAATGGVSSYSWLIMGAMVILMFWFMSRSNKKRTAALAAQREEMRASLEAGDWVRTASGFYGKVVELDGEVIVLSNLTGEETLWDVNAVTKVDQPPFAQVNEDEVVTQDDATSYLPPDAPETTEAQNPDDNPGNETKTNK